MSDNQGARKRFAEGQSSRDGDAPEEEFVTTPQIATAEQMAQRRVITVKRNPLPSSTSAAPAAAATEAKKEEPKPSSASPFGSVLGGFSSIGAPSGTAAKGFSFGGFGQPAAAPTTESKPAISFSFGAAPAATTAAPAAPMSFSFGAAPAAPAATTSEPAKPSFSFGAPAPAASGDAKPSFSFGTPTAAATDAKPAFSFGNSTGSFNFGAAVSNFAAARQQQQQEQQQKSADDGADDDEDPEKEEAIGGNGAKLAAVESVTGEEGERTEVEVTAKLQQFHADDKQWHDRGVGPLKLNIKVNDAGEHELVRFVMRDAKMKKALLNVNVQPVVFRIGQRGEKYFSFIAAEEGSVATYLIRVQGSSAVEETKNILSICDNFLKPKA